MTVIETVPQRLAIMGVDADARIRYATPYFAEQIDSGLRPAIVVEVGEADYPAVTAGMEQGIEAFRVLLIGDKYSERGENNQAEKLTRGIVANLSRYYARCTQLQFHNLRGLESTPLGPLAGVKWARMKRGGVGPVSRPDGEGDFWGCEFNITVEFTMIALETFP